jgi:hypothetical protein
VYNELGITLGPNLNYPIANKSYRPGLGFSAGLANNIYFGKHSLYVATIYERQTMGNNNLSENFIPVPNWIRYSTDYIMLPILYRYNFNIGPISPFVNAGPQIGCGFINTNTYNYDSQRYIAHNKTLECNFSVSIGMGIKVDIYKNLSLSGELRQSIWISSTYKNRNADSIFNGAGKGNINLILTAAYRFGK